MSGERVIYLGHYYSYREAVVCQEGVDLLRSTHVFKNCCRTDFRFLLWFKLCFRVCLEDLAQQGSVPESARNEGREQAPISMCGAIYLWDHHG